MGWTYNFLSEIDDVRDGTKILPILAIILDETDFMDAEPDWVNYLPGVKKTTRSECATNTCRTRMLSG